MIEIIIAGLLGVIAVLLLVACAHLSGIKSQANAIRIHTGFTRGNVYGVEDKLDDLLRAIQSLNRVHY